MPSLQQQLALGRTLVSDGAWGTFLHQRGLNTGECPEQWNIDRPDDVYAIAKSYVDAGADIILTNSFGGSPSKLAHYGLEERCFELNRAAAAISRRAAGSDTIVLGSIGPTGIMLMMGMVSPETLKDGFRIQAEGLKAGGADGVVVGTMSAIDEACLAIEAACEVGLEVACTFTFEKMANGDFRTMMGYSPVDVIRPIVQAGASVIGANCGNGFDNMIQIVRQFRAVDATTPILIHANAGLPSYVDGKTVFPESPEDMVAKLPELLKAGANIIGGCCGTTPAHIRALAHHLQTCGG